MTIKKQVQRFWKIFLEEQLHLERAIEENNQVEIDEIVKILNTYFEEMCNSSLEVSFTDQYYELTFQSGQDKNVQLVCVLLKEFTPEAVREKWIVNAFLPPMSAKAQHTVLRIKEQEYSVDDFIIYYEIDAANKCFNLEFYCDAFQYLEPSKANEIAIYMLQLCLGECVLEAYINTIEVVDAQQAKDYARLSQLYEVLVEIVHEEEWNEYTDPTTIYRAFHLQEEVFEMDVRKDMKMIFTTHPLLIQEVLNDSFVIYHEFFDFGGEFGYVYFENNGGNESDAAYRQHLEKKLQELLYPVGVAKNIGGALGMKYSYIDLAIYDKEAFIKALEKINNSLSINLLYRSFE